MATAIPSSPRASHVLAVEGLQKIYGGVVALRDANLQVVPGEVHGLVGENGAGKSTLLKSIAGEVVPDAGTISFGDEQSDALSPLGSRDLGLALVHQELANAPRLSVAESMALGVGFPSRGLFIDWTRLYRWAQGLLDEWGMNIRARQPIGTLTPAEQVIVAIISALVRDPGIVILDEPTASFSPPEVDHLLTVVRRLRVEGRSIVYVTHRLDEVFAVCDRVTVMREGRTVQTSPTADLSRDRLVELIVGHKDMTDAKAPPLSGIGPVRLQVEGLTGRRVKPVSFDVHQGEILGFAGLVGAGRTELFDLLYGATKATAGTISLDGRKVSVSSPSAAVRLGFGLVPEERGRSAIIPTMSVRENAVMPSIGRYASRFTRILSKRRQRADVRQIAERMHLRTNALEGPVRALSGGNQQKAVIARWLNGKSKVLIFDEPSRGVDIGAKEEIFDLIRQAAREGTTVLVASSEVEELAGLCHRILVMREGSVTGELTGEGLEPARILGLCFGA